MENLRNASVFSLLTILIGLAPMVMGAVYAIRPSERRLSMMRPLSLAAIFGSLCSMLLGFATVLRGISASTDPETAAFHFGAAGLGEALVPPLMTFAFLAVAWISVALGLRRQN